MLPSSCRPVPGTVEWSKEERSVFHWHTCWCCKSLSWSLLAVALAFAVSAWILGHKQLKVKGKWEVNIESHFQMTKPLKFQMVELCNTAKVIKYLVRKYSTETARCLSKDLFHVVVKSLFLLCFISEFFLRSLFSFFPLFIFTYWSIFKS